MASTEYVHAEPWLPLERKDEFLTLDSSDGQPAQWRRTTARTVSPASRLPWVRADTLAAISASCKPSPGAARVTGEVRISLPLPALAARCHSNQRATDAATSDAPLPLPPRESGGHSLWVKLAGGCFLGSADPHLGVVRPLAGLGSLPGTIPIPPGGFFLTATLNAMKSTEAVVRQVLKWLISGSLVAGTLAQVPPVQALSRPAAQTSTTSRSQCEAPPMGGNLLWVTAFSARNDNGSLPLGSTVKLEVNGVPLLGAGASVTFQVTCGPDAPDRQTVKLAQAGPAYFTLTNHASRDSPGTTSTDIVSATVTQDDQKRTASVSVQWAEPVPEPSCNEPTTQLGYLRALWCHAEKAKSLVTFAFETVDCAVNLGTFLVPAGKVGDLIDAASWVISDGEKVAHTAEEVKEAYTHPVSTNAAKLALDLAQLNQDDGDGLANLITNDLDNADSVGSFFRAIEAILLDVSSGQWTKVAEMVGEDAANLLGLNSCVALLKDIVKASSSTNTQPTSSSNWTVHVGGPGVPEGLSCPSSTWCAAVFHTAVGDAVTQTLVVLQDGTWEPKLTISVTEALDGVTCWAVDSCMLYGLLYQDGGETSEPYAALWDGSSGMTPTPAVGGAIGNHTWGNFAEVDCRSETFCMALVVAGSGNGSNNYSLPFSAQWNGQQWTTLPFPTLRGGGDGFGFHGTISCPSSDFCGLVVSIPQYVAYQSFPPGQQGDYAALGTWDGSKWHVLPAPLRSNIEGSSDDIPLSCVSARDCLVQDEQWDGRSWVPINTIGQITSAQVIALSCASVTSCDEFESGAGGTQPNPIVPGHYNGYDWVLGTATASPAGATFLLPNFMVCPTTTKCVAVGFEQTSKGQKIITYLAG